MLSGLWISQGSLKPQTRILTPPALDIVHAWLIILLKLTARRYNSGLHDLDLAIYLAKISFQSKIVSIFFPKTKNTFIQLKSCQLNFVFRKKSPYKISILKHPRQKSRQQKSYKRPHCMKYSKWTTNCILYM